MKHCKRTFVLYVLVIACIFLSFTNVGAFVSNSSSYRIDSFSFSSGGTKTNSSNYLINLLISEISGSLSSINYKNFLGFFYAAAGVPSPVSSCMNLSSANTVYTLTSNLNQMSNAVCVNISAQNITLDCAGFSIYTSNGINQSGVYSNQYNTTIKNCNITMGTGTNGTGISLDSGANNSYLFNNTLGNQNIGIQLTGVSNSRILNNSANVSCTACNGIYLQSTSTNNTLSGNNATSNSSSGIYLSYSDNNILTNNTANSNSNYAIYLFSSSSNNMTSNILTSNSGSGIYLIFSGDNIIKNNLGSTIYLYEYSGSNNIINNTVTGITVDFRADDNYITSNNVTSNSGTGISIGGRYNSITSNIATSNSGNAISIGSMFNTLTNNTGISNSSSGIYISSTNNILSFNNGTSNSSYGILIGSGGNSNNLTSNIGTSNSGSGIGLSSDGNTLTSNIGTSNSSSGIYLSISNGNNLTSNTGTSNSSSGIYFTHANSNTLTSNTGTSNSSSGIYLDSAHNNIFINNNATGLSAGSLGFNISISNNTMIQDCVNVSGVANDIQLVTNSWNTTFVNCTYNLSKESVDTTSQLVRQWYYRAYVNDTAGNPVSGANVSAFNSNMQNQFNLTTDSSGFIGMTSITDYVNNGTTRNYYSLYTINATNGISTATNTSYNVTVMQNNLMHVLTINSISVGISVLYPLSNVNVTQNQFFNVTLNVSCLLGNCGTVNVTLDPVDCSAIGGTITTDGDYCVHTFNSNGTFNITSPINVSVLVVAGGGAGAPQTGGGGGAGGLIYNSSYSVNNNVSVVVGLGGVGVAVASYTGYGKNGGNSSFGTLVAIGGGGGGANSGVGQSGGSGGGVGHNTVHLYGSGLQSSSASGGYGNNGGDHLVHNNPNYGASGGGGAGAVGSPGTTTNGGNGGDGLNFSINGSNVYYAGGGGGGTYSGGTLGLGGLGGGGNANIGDGVNNTGGGGAGQKDNLNDNVGSGGSGVVIVRYLGSQSSKGIISTVAGTTPFYTNASTNPLTTGSLNLGQSQVVTFFVNATGSVGNTYTFFAFSNLTSYSVSNITNTWNVTIISGNTFPNTPSVSINSSDGSNKTLADLNCFSTITDNDTGNKLNVSVIWYKNNIINLTLDYNNSYSNGTNFSAILGNGNTTKGENWSCGMRLYDGNLYSNWSNSSQLLILNSIPTIILVSPDDGNITTNRTPTFIWSGSDDDNDVLQYEFNMSRSAGGSLCTDTTNRYKDYNTILGNTSYTVSPYVKCLLDNGDSYNWTARVYDGQNYSNWSVSRNISVQALIDLSLPMNNVNFGNIAMAGTNNTTSGNPAPFILRNNGNAELNITANFTNLWANALNPSSNYQFKVNNITSGCFNYSNSTTTWTNAFASSTTGSIIQRLNFTSGYQTGCNNATIDIGITVPPVESPGNKSSIITFTGSLGEKY